VSEELHVIAHLKVADEAAFRQLVAEAIELVKTEEGTFAWEWHLDGRDCRVREHYRDSQAAEAHMQNMAELAPKIMAVSEIVAMDIYGAASDPLTDAVSQFGGKVWGPPVFGVA
jgi:quinol monooxygenase YgiN